MVSAEQSMHITKCGSPIWGEAAEHSRVSWDSREGLGALPFLGLLVPQAPSINHTVVEMGLDLEASHFQSKPRCLLPQSSLHVTSNYKCPRIASQSLLQGEGVVCT